MPRDEASITHYLLEKVMYFTVVMNTAYRAPRVGYDGIRRTNALMTSDHSQDTLCPLCGTVNRCAMAAGKSASACWCQGVAFSAEALSRIPEASRNKHCLCEACATRAHAQTEPAR